MRKQLHIGNHGQGREARLKRLAAGIETLARKDEEMLGRARQMDLLRRKAALHLHGICAGFAGSVNRLLSAPEVQIDPPVYDPERFRDDGPNLFQISVRGRILQISFEATAEMLSTENFRVPYAIEGAVRAFNQAHLERESIEEQQIFCTVENGAYAWKYFDARTYRAGPLDEDYLAHMFELLI